MADCIGKAGEICGSRGDVVLGVSAESPSAVISSGTNYYPMKTFHRNLFIQCKESEEKNSRFI